jgi:hypothetical protein
VSDRKGGRGKSGSRYAAGGGAAVEEQRYPEVAPPQEAPRLTEARRALAEGRGTAERLGLAEGLRAARRERDSERKADMLAGILAYRTKMTADRLRAEVPSPAVMKRVEAAFAQAPGAGNNFVKVRDVRNRLSDLPRLKVDAAILSLVRQRKFSMEIHEGTHGRGITRRERKSGLAGTGRDPFVYLTRRT